MSVYVNILNKMNGRGPKKIKKPDQPPLTWPKKNIPGAKNVEGAQGAAHTRDLARRAAVLAAKGVSGATTGIKDNPTSKTTGTRPSAGSGASGGGAPPVSGGTGGAPATTSGGAGASSGLLAGAQKAAGVDPMADMTKYVSAAFKGAYAEQARQRALVEARKLQDAADLGAFQKWMDTGLTKSKSDYAAAHKQAFDEAQASRGSALQRANEAITASRNAIGPVTGGATGLDSASLANAQAQGGVDAQAAQAAKDSAAQSDFLNQVSASDAARAANMMRERASDRTGELSDIDKAANQTKSDEAAALLQQRNADRDYGLNKSAADWAMKYQAGQLQNAADANVIANNAAQAKAIHDGIMEKLKAGEIDLKTARLQFDQATQDWKRKDKNADRALKKYQADLTAAGKKAGDAATRAKNAASYAITLPDKLTGNMANGRKWADLTDSDQDRVVVRQVVRSTIQNLKAAYPGLSQVEATRILASSLGGNRLQDFKGEIASAWRR